MSEIYIENLTWQGRPPGSTQPSGWSAQLGQVVNVFGQEKVNVSDPMTPDQLAGMGMDLPSVLSSINVQMNGALIAAQARVDALETQNGELAARIAQLEAQIPSGDAAESGEGVSENVA